MKLVKPSGSLGKRIFCDYFAHITKKQKLLDLNVVRQPHSNAASNFECSHCGESLDHRNAKHRLREMQGLFTFNIRSCPKCDKISLEEDCSSGQITLEVRSVDKKWRYDCLLKRCDGSEIALEIVHKHYTTEEKVLATRLSGIEIAEFRASDVLALVPGKRLDNLLEKRVKCLECLFKEGLEWFRDLYVEDFWIIWNFENILEEGYFIGEKKLLKKIELKRLNDEADMRWMLSIWENENKTIKELENDIDNDYAICWRMLKFRKSIHGLSLIEKTKLIIREYIREFYIIHSRYGCIQLNRIWKEDENGLYIQLRNWDGGMDDINTQNDMYIYLFDNDIEIKGNQWKPEGVERNFVIFLRTFKIINDLPLMEYKIRNCHETHEFKDCKWPILKQLETKFGGCCANCGIPGHVSENCKQKWCFRCGRKGHIGRQCYAFAHIKG